MNKPCCECPHDLFPIGSCDCQCHKVACEREKENELVEKINHYLAEIAELESEIASCDDSDVFESIRIVEASAKIRDYQARIERLQKRIAGQPTIENCPSDEQIRLADYVLSNEYDND